MVSGEVTVVAATPFSVIKAGVRDRYSSEKSTASKKTTKGYEFSSILNSVYIGEGIVIERDGIKLKETVVEEYI